MWSSFNTWVCLIMWDDINTLFILNMLGRPKLGRASKYEEAYKCEAAQYVRHPQFVRQLRFWENFNLNVNWMWNWMKLNVKAVLKSNMKSNVKLNKKRMWKLQWNHMKSNVKLNEIGCKRCSEIECEIECKIECEIEWNQIWKLQ